MRSLAPAFLAYLLLAWGGPALASALIVDARTGEAFRYTPSFARQKPEAPTYRAYDMREREWVTYEVSRKELRERHRMRFARARVNYRGGEPAGTIIVDTTARYLYLTLGDGSAMRYGIGVARDGFAWSGVETVTRKAEWPDWTPPADMREREPWLPEWMPGGPQNPMGAAALYLGSTLYRIHGTHQDHTIGDAVSSGCIRMLNDDIADLYRRTALGSRVVVLGPQSDRTDLIAALHPF